MAVISEIKTNAAGDKAKLYLDGEYYGTVSSDSVLRYGLRTGMEIDSEELDKLAGESDNDLAAAFILSYLTKYSATEKKARDMLKKKGYTGAAAEHAVAKAKEYCYIDDAAFAERYIERKILNTGMAKIKAELRMLGVKSSVINEAASEVDADDIMDGAMNVSRRWWSSRDVFDRTDRDKFVRYMGSKGYSWSITERCISAVKREESEAELEEEFENGIDD